MNAPSLESFMYTDALLELLVMWYYENCDIIDLPRQSPKFDSSRIAIELWMRLKRAALPHVESSLEPWPWSKNGDAVTSNKLSHACMEIVEVVGSCEPYQEFVKDMRHGIQRALSKLTNKMPKNPKSAWNYIM